MGQKELKKKHIWSKQTQIELSFPGVGESG